MEGRARTKDPRLDVSSESSKAEGEQEGSREAAEVRELIEARPCAHGWLCFGICSEWKEEPLGL